MPSASEEAAGKADRAPFFEGLLHGGAVGRLDADDPDSRQGLFQVKGDPGDQAAAAERADDRIHAPGQILLQELFADGALPGDDRGVPEGVNEDETFVFGNFQGQVGGVIHRASVQDDFRPVVPGGENLDQRGPLGHDDFGLDAEAPAVIGDGLGMVTRRGGDDPPGPVGQGKAQKFVEGPALLERPGHLEVLKLEKGLAAAELAQLLGVNQRGAGDLVADGQIGFLNIELRDQWRPFPKNIYRRDRRERGDSNFKRPKYSAAVWKTPIKYCDFF